MIEIRGITMTKVKLLHGEREATFIEKLKGFEILTKINEEKLPIDP